MLETAKDFNSFELIDTADANVIELSIKTKPTTITMLDRAVDATNLYIQNMGKLERKQYGQFFTSKETARYMVSLFDLNTSNIINQDQISILDAGAGTGILSIALIERLQGTKTIKAIELICYETDSKVIDVLKNNLEFTQKNSSLEISFKVINENYITSQSDEFNNISNNKPKQYDLIIGNPPYRKIAKDAAEAIAMPKVCYGAPNMYFLFTAMSLFNLKPDGEMVYIIPRSWTSGAYFKSFREYFLTNAILTNIHLFVSRNKVFDTEEVLQETIIIKAKKSKEKPAVVTISSSNSNKDFENITCLNAPYDLVISGNEQYVYLVTTQTEIDILRLLNKWNDTLPSLGLKMKTGLTVDFRNREILRNKPEKGFIPFFYSQHFKEGRIEFPIGKDGEYIETNQKGLLQENKNYLFVKRFTAKEEKRRFQCSIYLANKFDQYKYISTQNKINFIDTINETMTEELVYGLYVIFNSSIYDMYYRILNGSTQVNSTEVNNMPIPPVDIIEEMGRKLMTSNNLTVDNCNRIMEDYCG